jgi:hypothetical protein
MCWRSRLPIGLPPLCGRFSIKSAHSNARGRAPLRPNLYERGTVLGAVKTKPCGWPPKAASLDSPCARCPAALPAGSKDRPFWHEERNCSDKKTALT